MDQEPKNIELIKEEACICNSPDIGKINPHICLSCGGFIPDYMVEPPDTSISKNSNEDLLEFDFSNTSKSSEKSIKDTCNNVKAVCKYCGKEFNNYGLPSHYCSIRCFSKDVGISDSMLELNRIKRQTDPEQFGK